MPALLRMTSAEIARLGRRDGERCYAPTGERWAGMFAASSRPAVRDTLTEHLRIYRWAFLEGWSAEADRTRSDKG